jgi:hypothetical protein
MKQPGKHLYVCFVCLFMIGCSFKLSTEEVYGTYVAKYPFGTDVLKLNRDGSFVQTIDIESEPTQTAKGQWSFDPKNSYAKFYGLMIVDDGNGRLSHTWRTPTPTLVLMDLERHGFKVVMESAAAYPYLKQ